MRWPDGRHIEESSVQGHSAEFCERYTDVTDDQWANCDAVVSVNDIPEEYRQNDHAGYSDPQGGFRQHRRQGLGANGYSAVQRAGLWHSGSRRSRHGATLSLMKAILFIPENSTRPQGLWRPALNPLASGFRLHLWRSGPGPYWHRCGAAGKGVRHACGRYGPYLENGAELAVGIRRVLSRRTVQPVRRGEPAPAVVCSNRKTD